MQSPAPWHARLLRYGDVGMHFHILAYLRNSFASWILAQHMLRIRLMPSPAWHARLLRYRISIFWRISVTGGCTAESDVISSSTHAENSIDAIASSVACTVAEIRRCGQFCIFIFWRISVTGGCTAELDVIPSSTHAENSIDAIASSVACTVAEIRRCGQFCISIFWRISVTGRLHGRVGRYI